MIIGLRLGLSLATPLAAFLGTAVVEKHKQHMPVTPIVTKQKIAERLALAQIACHDCILDKADLAQLGKEGAGLSHGEIIKILAHKSSASNRCSSHDNMYKESVLYTDFGIVDRYLTNPMRRLKIKTSGVQSLISAILFYTIGIIESGKSAATFAALGWPAWYFFMSKLMPPLSESQILEQQKQWRALLLLNEDMGYYPYPIPTEHELSMAHEALEKMSVKHPIIVRMMQQRFQDENPSTLAYAHTPSGLICLKKNPPADYIQYVLLHEASHIANFDGLTSAGRRNHAACEANADRDAIKAIACKECAYHAASSAPLLRDDGYLGRSIMTDIIANRSDWGQPCSRHTRD